MRRATACDDERVLACQSRSDTHSQFARMPKDDKSLPSDARWHSVKMSIPTPITDQH
jgi:hypothetical protein